MATHTYANPIVAVLLGWLLAGEALNMRVIVASVAILGAIVLIRRGEQAASTDSQAKPAEGGSHPPLQAARRIS